MKLDCGQCLTCVCRLFLVFGTSLDASVKSQKHDEYQSQREELATKPEGFDFILAL